jgi:hypothetical protein
MRRDSSVPLAMRRALRSVVLLAAVAGLGVPAVDAQPALTATLGRGATAMAPAGAAGYQMTNGSVEAEQQLAGERLRLFYGLDAGTFPSEGDWLYVAHSAGATYRRTFGAGSKNALFAGVQGDWRSNGDAWADSRYHGAGGRVNLELHPRDTAAVRLGYRVDRRVFPGAPELDQFEHDAFASALFNLQTRTTLVGEVHAGRKTYRGVATADTVPASPPDAAAAHLPGAGRGNGKGAGMVPASLVVSSPARSDGPANQVTLFGRVAQSITDRTGVYLQVTSRRTFGGVPPAMVATPALFFDDGVYDDPFGSNAQVVAASVKHQFAGGMIVGGEASFTWKRYVNALAGDLSGQALPGDPLRADTLRRAGATWSLPLFPARTGPFAVSLALEYSFVDHHSNDAYYNYTSHAVALGTSIRY